MTDSAIHREPNGTNFDNLPSTAIVTDICRTMKCRHVPPSIRAILKLMSITLDEVRHVAKLARLELDEAEMLSLQGELNALLGHFGDIQGIDTAGIEPTSHAVAVQNVWAEDIPIACLPRDKVLRNAAVSRAGLFVVPMIIED
jgi:aspartyl-tRNA(Asn)/glutamyl-tRNA(Gln) amidotransferase subunit C